MVILYTYIRVSTDPNPSKALPSISCQAHLLNRQNMQADQLFLLLNISDFNLFLCENCNPLPLEKVTPSFPATPLKVKVLSSPLPFFENLVGGSTPSPAERGGYTLYILMFGLCMHLSKIILIFTSSGQGVARWI